MAVKQQPRSKKYFTPDEANKALPLVKAIVGDIRDLATSMKERHDRLEDAKGFERQEIEDSLADDQFRLQELVDELSALGVELKDFFSGLVDFPCWFEDREIYLCWKLDEPTIGHWHETSAGFAGRKKL